MSLYVGTFQYSFVAGIVCHVPKSSSNVCFVGDTPILYWFVVEVPTKIVLPRESFLSCASVHPLKSW